MLAPMNSPNPYEPPASLDPPLAEPDSDETEPEEELAPSSREDDAARALKSAVLGLLFCPLQLYTAWLLFLVVVSHEPLRRRYFWYAVGAWAVLLPYVITAVAILAFLRAD
jgi:hypothetical protein